MTTLKFISDVYIRTKGYSSEGTPLVQSELMRVPPITLMVPTTFLMVPTTQLMVPLKYMTTFHYIDAFKSSSMNLTPTN